MQAEAEALRPFEILLVEDSAGDARLAIEAFRECRTLHRIRVVPDGASALAYLRREGEYASASRPDLILLDLNLPVMSGLDVLAEIKNDPDLRTIPVVVLTTSLAERDVRSAYEAYANCYIAKPVDYEGFASVVELIERFWMNTVALPPH
ncbi:MAG: response regulator [Candidatus Dadabacteria bacterium]|nr:MAG: response regulator [Candidatus Dadabacteria bacterium]